MTTITYDSRRALALAGERKTTLANCKSIVARAKDEGRELTDAETAAVEAGMARIKANEPEEKALARAAVDAAMKLGTADQDPEVAGSTGFFTPEAKEGVLRAIKSRTSFRAELPAKAAVASGALLPTSGTLVQEGLHPNAQFPLASLFRNVPAEGPVQRYYRMGAGTAASSPRAHSSPTRASPSPPSTSR
jgi:hypothetical protein